MPRRKPSFSVPRIKPDLIAPMNAARFRIVRTETLQVSQQTLADLLGYDLETISRWEREVMPVPLIAAHAMRWLAHLAKAAPTKIKFYDD